MRKQQNVLHFRRLNEAIHFMFIYRSRNDKYEVCPEGIQPCTVKNRDIYWGRYKIQETLYIGQWPSVPFKVGTVGPHTALPNTVSCPVIFSWISLVVWNLITFKGDFSFGKMQKLQGTKSGLWGIWVTWVIWCFTKKFCSRHGAWAGTLSWWSYQSPVAHKRQPSESSE